MTTVIEPHKRLAADLNGPVGSIDDQLNKVLAILQAELDYLYDKPPVIEGVDTLNRISKIGSILIDLKRFEETTVDSILALKTPELKSLFETIQKELDERLNGQK